MAYRSKPGKYLRGKGVAQKVRRREMVEIRQWGGYDGASDDGEAVPRFIA